MGQRIKKVKDEPIAIIDIAALTLAPEEATSISEVIFEQKIAYGDINDLHLVITGIQAAKKIPFVGDIPTVGQCLEACEIPDGARIPMSEKVWDPKRMGFRLENCSADLDNLLSYVKKKIRVIEDIYDFSGSPEENVIMLRAMDGMEEMLWRLIEFGDKDIANQTNGGELVDGEDVNKFNCIDGLWKQLTTMYGAGVNGGAFFTPITQNGLASYAAQTLTGQQAYDYIKAVYRKADPRLKENENAVIYVTRSVADAYLDYLEEKSIVNSFNVRELLRTQGEQPKKTFLLDYYRGVPIMVVPFWDKAINAYFNNGTIWSKPNRILFTTKSNIPIGTPSTEMLGSMKSFYSEYHKVNIVDAEIFVDVKVLEDYMASVAY